MIRFIATALILTACLVSSTAVSAGDIAPADIRQQAGQLCDQGRFAEATNFSMKHLLEARSRFGGSSQVVADHLMIVAEVARRRGKFYLAQKLYDRALGIQSSTAVAVKTDSVPVLEQERVADLKSRVNSMCDSADFAGAVHISMSELLRAKSEYGNLHPYTAQYTAIVGDVARLRGKFYLASVLYQKAFAMLQDEIGTTVSRKTAHKKMTELRSF